jgi:hypothetical protein
MNKKRILFFVFLTIFFIFFIFVLKFIFKDRSIETKANLGINIQKITYLYSDAITFTNENINKLEFNNKKDISSQLSVLNSDLARLENILSSGYRSSIEKSGKIVLKQKVTDFSGSLEDAFRANRFDAEFYRIFNLKISNIISRLNELDISMYTDYEEIALKSVIDNIKKLAQDQEN